MARAGLAIDLDAAPVLAVRLDGLSDGVRYRARYRLPHAPRAGAVDPDMPSDQQARFGEGREIWP